MGGEEIDPAEDQPTSESSPSSSIEQGDLQDVETSACRLVSPTRADFIDGTPPVQIRPKPYSNRQAELEDERERLLEKSRNSPTSVNRWLKLLRDRDKLLRLTFCQENASILEGQIKHLENTCKSVERLARCPDPLVEQFCTTVGDIIKLCPLILAHVRNPTLHDHMERGQSPVQPSAPSPQHSWVENERRMSSEFTKERASPSSNQEFMGSPTSTPPKYSSTQNVGQAIDAFKAGSSIWSPLTPDESNGTNHIQSAENSLIGSYFALPGPNNSLQDCSTPGSLLSVSCPHNTQVTLATQTSPMLKSIESGNVPVYKPTNFKSTPNDSNGNLTSSNSSAYLNSYDPNLATKKNIYSSKIPTLSKHESEERNISSNDSTINLTSSNSSAYLNSYDPNLATKKNIYSSENTLSNPESEERNISHNDSTGNKTSSISSGYLDSYDPTLATEKNIFSSENQALSNPESEERNISLNDSTGNKTSSNSSAYLDSYDPTLATEKNIYSSENQALSNPESEERNIYSTENHALSNPDSDERNIYQSENKALLSSDSFKNIFNHSNVNFLTLQTSPLLEFANTKDMSVFKNTDYTPLLNISEIKKDKKWRTVKNRRRKKKKKETANEDMSSGDENTPGRDIASPPKRARINSEYDDEKVTRALVAAIQNLGQPSRYVILEHLDPTLV